MNTENPKPSAQLPEAPKCYICHADSTGVFGAKLVYGVCEECNNRYGPALVKAHVDQPFDYAIKLTSGELYRTTGINIQGDWVTIEPANPETGIEGRTASPQGFTRSNPYPCARGITVPLWAIVWVADAPEGS